MVKVVGNIGASFLLPPTVAVEAARLSWSQSWLGLPIFMVPILVLEGRERKSIQQAGDKTAEPESVLLLHSTLPFMLLTNTRAKFSPKLLPTDTNHPPEKGGGKSRSVWGKQTKIL